MDNRKRARVDAEGDTRRSGTSSRSPHKRHGNIVAGTKRQIRDKRYYDGHAAKIAEKRRDKKIREALKEANLDEESICLVWDEMVEEAKRNPYMKKPQIVSKAFILLANKHTNRPPPVAQPVLTSALGATATNTGNQHMMAAMTAQMTPMMAMTGMPAFTTGMPLPGMMATGLPFTGMAGVPAMMTMPPGGASPGSTTSGTNVTSMNWRNNMMAMASAHANAATTYAAYATSALSSANATSAGLSGVAPKHLPAAPLPAMTMGISGKANDIKADATIATPAKGITKDSNAESTASASTGGSPAKAKTSEDEMMDVAKVGQVNTSLAPISAAKSPPGTQFMVPSAPSPTSIADLPISGDDSPSNSAKGDEVSSGVGIDILIGSDENDDSIDGRKIPEHEDDQSAVGLDLGDDDEKSAKAAPKVRPKFDLPYVQTIGDGIFDGKIAQIDVNGVGKDRIMAKLTFLPPRSSPREYMYQIPGVMDALANGKSTLRDHFEVGKEEIGGTEKIDALDLEVSSNLYHTLVLCKPDRKCTCLSFVMFQRIEGSEDWWVPWLATNKDKQYMKRGYSRFLLETVKQLASGFGAKNIYLEVGIPSMMPDYTGDENDDDKDTEASKWARAGTFYSRLGFVSAGDDVPDEVLSLCKEVRKGTHEVLRRDLTTT